MNRSSTSSRPGLCCLAAGLALAVALSACGQKKEPLAIAPGATGIVAAAPGWVDVEGGIQRLGARTDGVVRQVMVHEGDRVAAGAVLIRLDEDRARLDRDAAELEVRRRQQELGALHAQQSRLGAAVDRLRPLVAQQAEPEDDLRQLQAQFVGLGEQVALAKTAVQAALLQQRMTETKLAQQQVKSPAAGEVLRVLARDGDAVTAGAPLLWLAADGPLRVRAELDERLFGRVLPGMSAEVSAESGGPVFHARVLRVARVVGPVRNLPEVRPAAQDDRVVECVLALDGHDLLVGQRVLVRILASP